MTRSATAPRSPLHGSGPWLIITGPGAESERVGAFIAQQCYECRVEPVRVDVDHLQSCGRELIFYLGLVMVLPDPLVDGQRVSQLLAPYRILTKEYRARRSGRLRDAVLGEKPWYAVGVVQLVGANSILRAPALRTVRDQCCDQHPLERNPEPDVFRAYSRLPEPVADSSRYVGEHVERRVVDEAVLRVRDWGIAADEAPALLALINQCRNDYERPSRPAMYRPIAGVNLNRLDLILDGRPENYQADDATWSRMIGNTKTWTENNAAVWREIEAIIVSHFANFHFPALGNKGVVEGFHRLYQDLLAIEPYCRRASQPAPRIP